MSDSHQAILLLGSNIQPEYHLRRAVELLKAQGQVSAISNAWETRAVGSPGSPNFLNACVLLNTIYSQDEIMENLIQPVEAALGRLRGDDKNQPRSIDIDLVFYDGQPQRLEYWDEAFMLIPLAELIPGFEHPRTHLRLGEESERARSRVWTAARPEVLHGLSTEKA